jgi:hypothetical protein
MQVARNRLEMDPAPDQRERDRGGDDAAPHDQPVREPSEPSTPEDVRVPREFHERAAYEADRVPAQRRS